MSEKQHGTTSTHSNKTLALRSGVAKRRARATSVPWWHLILALAFSHYFSMFFRFFLVYSHYFRLSYSIFIIFFLNKITTLLPIGKIMKYHKTRVFFTML